MIEHVDDNGTHTDITTAVQTMYDLIVDSMDWTSGFLAIEDCIAIERIAVLCGWETPAEAANQIAAYERLKRSPGLDGYLYQDDWWLAPPRNETTGVC